jgi:hypothetical protein
MNPTDKPRQPDEPDYATGWNYCPYCDEAVQPPALYCCEEHEEGRSIG